MTPGGGSAARPVVALFDAYPNKFGGAQRTLLDIASDAVQFAPIVAAVGGGHLADRAVRAGHRVANVAIPRALERFDDTIRSGGLGGKVAAVFGLITTNLRAARLLRRLDADVAYCSNTRTVLLVGAGARMMRRPVVWYVQTLESSLGLADRVAARLATRILTISDRPDPVGRVLTPAIMRRHGHKVGLLRLGVVDATTSTSTSISTSTSTSISDVAGGSQLGGCEGGVLFVGEISERKGVPFLIDAAFQLAESGIAVTVRLVGAATDPAFVDNLTRVIEGRRSAATIEFLGSREDVLELMAQSAVVVLPAVREGLPRVVAEAMSVGTCVVATDVGATADLVIDGETGLLVGPRDASALASALRRVLVDGSLRARLAAAGQQHVRTHFSRQQFVADVNAEFVAVSAPVGKR